MEKLDLYRRYKEEYRAFSGTIYEVVELIKAIYCEKECNVDYYMSVQDCSDRVLKTEGFHIALSEVLKAFSEESSELEKFINESSILYMNFLEGIASLDKTEKTNNKLDSKNGQVECDSLIELTISNNFESLDRVTCQVIERYDNFRMILYDILSEINDVSRIISAHYGEELQESCQRDLMEKVRSGNTSRNSREELKSLAEMIGEHNEKIFLDWCVGWGYLDEKHYYIKEALNKQEWAGLIYRLYQDDFCKNAPSQKSVLNILKNSLRVDVSLRTVKDARRWNDDGNKPDLPKPFVQTLIQD
jgi:hypothetical protein